MIKRIIIRQVENIQVPLTDNSFIKAIDRLTQQTVALSTSAIEELILKESTHFVSKGSTIEGSKNLLDNKVSIHTMLDTYLINRSSFEDFLAVIKHGDVAAKKRLLKELEGL